MYTKPYCNKEKNVITISEVDKKKNIVTTGKAKCNHIDNFSFEKGKELARLRAHVKFERAKEVYFKKISRSYARQALYSKERADEAEQVAKKWSSVLEEMENNLKY
jgi:hypothetical protein